MWFNIKYNVDNPIKRKIKYCIFSVLDCFKVFIILAVTEEIPFVWRTLMKIHIKITIMAFIYSSL